MAMFSPSSQPPPHKKRLSGEGPPPVNNLAKKQDEAISSRRAELNRLRGQIGAMKVPTAETRPQGAGPPRGSRSMVPPMRGRERPESATGAADGIGIPPRNGMGFPRNSDIFKGVPKSHGTAPISATPPPSGGAPVVRRLDKTFAKKGAPPSSPPKSKRSKSAPPSRPPPSGKKKNGSRPPPPTTAPGKPPLRKQGLPSKSAPPSPTSSPPNSRSASAPSSPGAPFLPPPKLGAPPKSPAPRGLPHSSPHRDASSVSTKSGPPIPNHANGKISESLQDAPPTSNPPSKRSGPPNKPPPRCPPATPPPSKNSSTTSASTAGAPLVPGAANATPSKPPPVAPPSEVPSVSPGRNGKKAVTNGSKAVLDGSASSPVLTKDAIHFADPPAAAIPVPTDAPPPEDESMQPPQPPTDLAGHTPFHHHKVLIQPPESESPLEAVLETPEDVIVNKPQDALPGNTAYNGMNGRLLMVSDHGAPGMASLDPLYKASVAETPEDVNSADAPGMAGVTPFYNPSFSSHVGTPEEVKVFHMANGAGNTPYTKAPPFAETPEEEKKHSNELSPPSESAPPPIESPETAQPPRTSDQLTPFVASTFQPAGNGTPLPKASSRRDTLREMHAYADTPITASIELRTQQHLAQAEQEKTQLLRRVRDLEDELSRSRLEQVPPSPDLQAILHMAETQGEKSAISWARDHVANGNGKQVGFMSPLVNGGAPKRTPRRSLLPRPKHQAEGVESIFLVNAATTVSYEFETELATFIIRRPYGLAEEDMDLWLGLGTSTARQYAKNACVSNSGTIEVVARIEADGSFLAVYGDSFARRQDLDGNWEEYDNVYDRDSELGEVAYIAEDGAENFYSLDEIFEAATSVRLAYCSSVMSTAVGLRGNEMSREQNGTQSQSGPAAVHRAETADVSTGTEDLPAPKPKKEKKKKPPPEEPAPDVLSTLFGMFFSGILSLLWHVFVTMPLQILSFTISLATSIFILSLIWVYIANDNGAIGMGAVVDMHYNVPGIA